MTDLALFSKDVLLRLGIDAELGDDIGEGTCDSKAQHDQNVWEVEAEVEAGTRIDNAQNPTVRDIVHHRAKRGSLIEVASLEAVNVINQPPRNQQAKPRPPESVQEEDGASQTNNGTKQCPVVGVQWELGQL